MGSGLILLLIVGAWLAVLVPVALRSHEASSALATVDKFHDAMRVLSRRGVARRGGGSARSGSAPSGSAARAVDGVQDDSPPVEVPAEREASAARRRLTPAARRLRVLVALVVVAVATLGGALVGSPWLLVPHLVTDLALVGFVCWLRSQAVAKEEQEWRRAMGERRPAPAPAASSVRVTPARAASRVVPPARVAGIPDRMPSRALVAASLVTPSPIDGAAERLVAVPAARAEAPAESLAEAPVRVRGAQGEPWQPVPVPAPMYVSAPAAPRRVLDLTRPAPAASLSSAERSVGIDDHGPELDHILDRRAVGD